MENQLTYRIECDAEGIYQIIELTDGTGNYTARRECAEAMEIALHGFVPTSANSDKSAFERYSKASKFRENFKKHKDDRNSSNMPRRK